MTALFLALKQACGNASSFVTRAKSFGFNDQNARLDLSKLTSEPASTVEELKNLVHSCSSDQTRALVSA